MAQLESVATRWTCIISKMPEKAKQSDWFYLRAVSAKSSLGSWYSASPIGEHTLASMVKDMFNEIGIGDKTNHSLRATGASILFQSNVPEKIIQERTGHRSLKALLSLDLGKEPVHCTKRQRSRCYCSSSPLSASWYTTSAQNCTININCGPSHISVAQDNRKFDDVDFPEQVEKELACIEYC